MHPSARKGLSANFALSQGPKGLRDKPYFPKCGGYEGEGGGEAVLEKAKDLARRHCEVIWN